MNRIKDQEAAELLGIKPGTLRVWRHKGQQGKGPHGPKFYKVGGKVYYDRADVLAWLESCCREPVSAGAA